MTVTNKQLVKAFKAAKKHLWDGKGSMSGQSGYICYALDYAVFSKKISPNEKEAARVIVRELISPWYTLEGWLEWTAKVPSKKLTRVAVQTYRREWLDHLIKEYSK